MFKKAFKLTVLVLALVMFVFVGRLWQTSGSGQKKRRL